MADETNYINYRKIFRKVAAEAENTCYKSMFDHKSICIKILRKNLNIVCSLNKCKMNSNATNKFKLFTDDTHLFISGIDKNANNNECNDCLKLWITGV